MQRSTQHPSKTDGSFLPDLQRRDARARRHLEVEIKRKLNARLAIRQRADSFGANISANKVSLPQDQSYTEEKAIMPYILPALRSVLFLQFNPAISMVTLKD